MDREYGINQIFTHKDWKLDSLVVAFKLSWNYRQDIYDRGQVQNELTHLMVDFHSMFGTIESIYEETRAFPMREDLLIGVHEDEYTVTDRLFKGNMVIFKIEKTDREDDEEDMFEDDELEEEAEQ
jgi:hypothetical protein